MLEVEAIYNTKVLALYSAIDIVYDLSALSSNLMGSMQTTLEVRAGRQPFGQIP
jgi:hypothetical protein